MIGIKRAAVIAAISLAAGPLWLVPQNAAWAQAALQYKIGDRVAAPIGAQYFNSVIIQVRTNPLSYRVHPLGFLGTADFTANPQMLRALGSVQIQPHGGIASDPYLVSTQGPAAQQPASAFPLQAQNAPRQTAIANANGPPAGLYQCRGVGGMIAGFNFTIGGGGAYTTTTGQRGTFTFAAASGRVTFQGAPPQNAYQGIYKAGPPAEINMLTVTGAAVNYVGIKCQIN